MKKSQEISKEKGAGKQLENGGFPLSFDSGWVIISVILFMNPMF